MKSSTKRILMSVLTLVLTVVALGTTTFAWFSLSNIGTVTGISANVQAGDGLEVKLHKGGYDTGFKNHLVADDWTGFMTSIEDNGNPFRFGAVTTPNGKDTFKELTVREADGHLELSAVADPNKNYLEFDLSFRSLQGGTIALTDLVLGGAAQTFDPAGGNAYDQMNAAASLHKVTAFAANAARVSFTHGTIPTTVVFENTLAAYAENSGVITGNYAGQTTGVAFGQWAYLKSRGIRVFDGANEILDVNLAANSAIASTVQLSALENALVITLEDDIATSGYFIATVTVRIWMEGWDADTYDSIFNANLTVSLTFEKTTA